MRTCTRQSPLQSAVVLTILIDQISVVAPFIAYSFSLLCLSSNVCQCLAACLAVSMRRLISDRKHKKNTDLKCVHIVYTYTGVCIHNVMDIPMCIYIYTRFSRIYIYNIYIYIYVFCLCSRYPYTFTYVGFLYITLCSIYTGCIKTCISFMQSYVYLLC